MCLSDCKKIEKVKKPIKVYKVLRVRDCAQGENGKLIDDEDALKFVNRPLSFFQSPFYEECLWFADEEKTATHEKDFFDYSKIQDGDELGDGFFHSFEKIEDAVIEYKALSGVLYKNTKLAIAEMEIPTTAEHVYSGGYNYRIDRSYASDKLKFNGIVFDEELFENIYRGYCVAGKYWYQSKEDIEKRLERLRRALSYMETNQYTGVESDINSTLKDISTIQRILKEKKEND